MSKFFMKKKVIIIMVAAIVAVMVGLIIGTNIVNTMKAKEKAAEKVKVEQTIAERKEAEESIKKSKSDKPSEEDNYTEEYKEYEKLSDEEKAKTDVIPRKEQVDFGELKKIEEDQKEDIGTEYVLEEDKEENDNKEVLPKHYNLKDNINLVVGDQQKFGLCWDYASLTSVQSNLALTQGEDYNFSESHIDYMTSNEMSIGGRDVNEGGNFAIFMNYNEKFKGFVLEEEIPQNIYEDYEYNTFYNVPKEDMYITKYVDFPRMVKNDEMSQEEYDAKFKEFQTAVKTHIMNYGSVCASVYGPWCKDLYISSNDGAYANHMISIVGWDDNYSRENFYSIKDEKPEHDGAYIALNSWGEDFGESGYFYISYEDCLVNKEMSGIISINKKSDLIKVNELGKNMIEFIRNNYNDKIVELDGEEYIREEVFGGFIDLSGLNISDISDFYSLISKASWINLSDNNLESIDGIENYICKEDVVIILANNNIKDVSCLQNVKISTLKLDGNYGVTGYENLDISYQLSLKDCGITSFDVGEKQKSIESLNLSGNTIDDFSNITKLEGLQVLELNNCNLGSLEKIKDILKMNSISYLDVSDNNLTSITGLENASMYEINLSNNTEIENFEPLRKIKDIYCVVLNNCNIKDASEVLIETVTEEELEKTSNLIEDTMYEPEDLRFGISYVLSENKEIYNIKALKNAQSISLEDCDLGDITELKELKYLKNINLSHNHNLTGDLSGMDIYFLTVIDCGLNNDFNIFNIDLVTELNIRENDIDKIDNFEDKVTWTIYMDSYDGNKETKNGAYISVSSEENEDNVDNVVEIEIPDEDGLKMDFVRYKKNIEGPIGNIKVNGKIFSSFVLIPIDETTNITYWSYENGMTTIKFKINPEMKNSGIEVMYSPYLNRLKNDNEIKAENIRVAETYGNGISKETTDFELGSEIYKLPCKNVMRGKGLDSRYIYVPEKYYMLVSQGDYTAKYAVGRMSGYNIIDVNLCEDLTPPDDFEEEFPTLRFDSEELYNIAKDYWDGLYVRADDDLLTIELKEYRERNDSGLPMYIPRRLLWDADALKPVIATDIYILMDEENGMDRIGEGNLKDLEILEQLENIHIITPPEEYNQDDLIVPQDKYTIIIENGVG